MQILYLVIVVRGHLSFLLILPRLTQVHSLPTIGPLEVRALPWFKIRASPLIRRAHTMYRSLSHHHCFVEIHFLFP